ncbi:DUF1294 domain-containing protein [Planctomycetota bacterium]|nr:DUF1294 domain-containing protein [Planctomycetota bacterium]
MTWQHGILIAALVVNLVTFCTFGWDKFAAKRNWWRVPELRLLGLCLAGGLLGGWAGMAAFRHKTSKRSFQLKMVGVSAVWVGVAALAVWWALRASPA